MLGHMQRIKDTIYRRWQLIFVVLVVGMFPRVAEAHGAEQAAVLLGLIGFFVGLITGVICTFRQVSFRYAISRSFGIYVLILMALGFFYFAGSIYWSELFIVVLVFALGSLVGLIPLALGIVAMSSILNRFIKRK